VLFTFGELARIIGEEAHLTAAMNGRELPVSSFGPDETDSLIEALRETLQEGDMLLLKGSRGLEMERVVSALREPAPDEEDAP
jgi:UDP-N-acetylmuramoyl-tripeptide--D-alanyl-D-alanine ligase